MKKYGFPQILKQLCMAKNMTQDNLANELNVSRSTIAGYEVRNNQTDYDKLVQIADLYNVTIDFLLSGEMKSLQDINAHFNNDKTLEQQLVEAFQPLPYEAKLHILNYACYQKERHLSNQ